MPVKLVDKLLNEAGAPVQGASAQAILTDGTATTVVATDMTDTKGVWAFDSSVAGHQPDLADPAAGFWYDVRINAGMQYRLRYGAIKAMMSMVYLSQTILLGASQLFDASQAALRIPAKVTDPVSPAAGEFLFRTDTRVLRIYDGSAWLTIGNLESAYAGTTVLTGVNYTVVAGVLYVFCTAAVTVTLPAAASTNRPVTVVAVTGQSGVNAAGGSVIGGSAHPTTGAIQNGVVAVPEAFTYKSDGTNWRAV